MYFVTAKEAARVLQAQARSNQLRRVFLAVRQAIIAIQALARQRTCQKAWWNTLQASVKLQARFRAFGALKQAHVRSCAVVRLQSAARRTVVYIGMRQQQSAATRLQAWGRTIQAQSRFYGLVWATIMAQSRCRSRCGRVRYLRTKAAVILVQSLVRRIAAQQAMDYAIATITYMQAVWRGYLLRKHLRDIAMATRLQAWVRMGQAQGRFYGLLWALLGLQAAVRRRRATRDYIYTRDRIVRLQSFARTCTTRRVWRRTHQAAVKLQAWHRGWAALGRHWNVLWATMIIQSQCRALNGRAWYLNTKAAALCLQATARRMITQRAFNYALTSIVCMQALWRGCLARTRIMRSLAATWLQCIVRRFKHRSIYLRTRVAAVIAQAWARERILRFTYLKQRGACTVAQKWRRRVIAQQQWHTQQTCLRTLQAAGRGLITRQRVVRCHSAATTIQSWARQLDARWLFALARMAAVILQAGARQQAARIHYLRLRAAVLVVQVHIMTTTERYISPCQCPLLSLPFFPMNLSR